GEDQSPAGSARPYAAQRNALRGWVRRAAARPAKKREARYLAQRLVKSQRAACREVLGSQEHDIGRRLGKPRLRARRRHDNVLDEGYRRQNDGKLGRFCPGAQVAFRCPEPSGLNGQLADRTRHRVENKPAVATSGSCGLEIVCPKNYSGADDDVSGFVLDYSLDEVACGFRLREGRDTEEDQTGK